MIANPTRTASNPDYELNDSYDDRLIATPLQQKSNVLSGKISSVLSASYADSEIRDALQALDSTSVQNTPNVRRNLSLDVQKEVIDCNAEILDQFGTVAERLRRIGSTIYRLNQCCDDIQTQLMAAHRENGPILDEASTLLGQKNESETKKQLLEAFNKHYIMSEKELRALTTNADVVDDFFFEVLNRVKRIHKDCQILLGTENQRLGLELMEQSSRNLNSAYQRLYRWIQREFKMLNFENPQVSSMIRRALKALAERPTLFQSCLDFFAEAREHVLLDAFYAALTGPSDGLDRDTVTKPIEYHSHDPLRYVGDMLAWTHAASVSEREALDNLATADGEDIVQGIKRGTESEPWSTVEGEAFDGRRALEELAGRNLNGVVQVIRQRVEQVIYNQDDAVLVYKFVNLLCFYRVTFTKLLGSGNTLIESLTSLEEVAFRQFETIMAEHVRYILTDADRPPPDMRSPDFLTETLDQLKVLIKSFDSSLTPITSREEDFKRIIDVALDPFLDICRKIAQDSEEPHYSIFLINCLQAAQATLSDYDFVQQKVSALEDDVKSYATTLTDFQHSFFLHSSGLYPMMASLAPWAPFSENSSDTIAPIQELPTFQPAALQDASQTLDVFLPSASIDAKENIKHLNNKKLASNITTEAAERFCEDFGFVEAQLAAFDESEETTKDTQEHGGLGEASQLLRQYFPRTTGEIRVLLS